MSKETRFLDQKTKLFDRAVDVITCSTATMKTKHPPQADTFEQY